MKIFSWNVNGIRAIIRKGSFQEFLEKEDPEIICLQETKAKRGQVEANFKQYEEVWNSAERPGYSGTAIFTKRKPISVRTDLPTASGAAFVDKFGDVLAEGRVLTAEFEDFFLVNVYVPNSKPNLERLDLRERAWDPAFLAYLKELEENKPVVTCGDFNAAHKEIDLARPQSNHHHAGFTDQERQGISNLLDAGFIDTFRFLHPDEVRYTWWSHFAKARENNVGWRIDYFFISEDLKKKLKAAEIYDEIRGSDHCPISITI